MPHLPQFVCCVIIFVYHLKPMLCKMNKVNSIHTAYKQKPKMVQVVAVAVLCKTFKTASTYHLYCRQKYLSCLMKWITMSWPFVTLHWHSWEHNTSKTWDRESQTNMVSGCEPIVCQLNWKIKSCGAVFRLPYYYHLLLLSLYICILLL